jgi:hypothetical protein
MVRGGADLVLAGWSALKPEPVSWVFVAVVFDSRSFC